jgi:hypothetical protein
LIRRSCLDALNTQTDIAQQSFKDGGGYTMAAKDNLRPAGKKEQSVGPAPNAPRLSSAGVEESCFGGGGKDRDGGVLELAFGCDRVKTLGPLAGFSKCQHLVSATYLLGDNTVDGEEPESVPAEDLDQRRVVKLRDDVGLDPLGLEPAVERPSQRGMVGGQKRRCPLERCGEARAESLRKWRWPVTT